MEQLPELFSSRWPQQEKAREELEAELYQQIGQLKMELEWLKKISDAPLAMKRAEVEKALATMSVVRQCGLLELSHSTFYYRPVGEDAYNLALMRRIDEQFTKRPFYGVPRMTASLHRMGYGVNPKRVRRLMWVMGLEAIYPKPRPSANGPDHKVYLYLLKEVTVDRPDQAWATDITYVRLTHGFVYLIAILDWYSRHVVSWELSTTLDTGFCLEALRKALRISKPEIFNTDQGPQFTSVDFTDLSDYFEFYNNERPHETLGYRTPHEVYFGTRAALAPASEAVV